MCYQKEETITHLFMECNRANRIWFGSSLGIKFNSNHRNFIEWLFYCLDTLKEEELCYIAAITYSIWFARNKTVFENLDLEDGFIIRMAMTTLQDYQKANMQNEGYSYNNNHVDTRRDTNRGNQHRNKKWKKPRTGIIKANSDANLSIDGSWGLGAIFRDGEGHIMASATWVRSGFHDPATAEACALYFTMRLAADCCFTTVEFESDCLNVVKAVNSALPSPRNYFGNLIRGIHQNLGRFRQATFKFIDRKANRVAHKLAGLAHSSPNCTWVEETHPLIVPIVLMDLF
jgi:hypothetical protein